MSGSRAPRGAWFVSAGSWPLEEFGVEVVGSEWLATLVFLFAVRLTQQFWDFPWLFFITPVSPWSACAEDKFQLY